jgi:hypothetical protein
MHDVIVNRLAREFGVVAVRVDEHIVVYVVTQADELAFESIPKPFEEISIVREPVRLSPADLVRVTSFPAP